MFPAWQSLVARGGVKERPVVKSVGCLRAGGFVALDGKIEKAVMVVGKVGVKGEVEVVVVVVHL